MRRNRWLTMILGMLASAGLADSSPAQEPGGFGPGGYGPGGYGPGGAAYSPAAQYPDYSLDAAFQPGGMDGRMPYPSYYQPYPQMSPYDYDHQQLDSAGGLWQYDQSNRGGRLKYRFHTEYIRSRTEKGRDRIGHERAPTYRQQIVPVIRGLGGGGGGGQNLAQYADALEGTNNGGLGFNLFDPVSAKELEKPEADGLRMTLEIETAYGNGFELWGFWANDDDARLDARNQIAVGRGSQQDLMQFIIDNLRNPTSPPASAANLPGFPEDTDLIFANNLLNLRGIPLDDGSFQTLPDGTILGGASAVYDLNFRVDNNIEMYGTGLRWKGDSIYNTSVLSVRPAMGLRYMSIQEHFGFFGQDSGLLYAPVQGNNPVPPDVKLHSVPNFVDDDGDGVVDSAGIIEDRFGNQGGGGQTGTATFFTGNNFNSVYPVTSILNNDINSQLLGPEFGLNYQLGSGDHFRLGGATSFGIMANYQRIKMSGDNIFVTTREADLNIPNNVDARPNDFYRSEDHLTVSPLIEQSIFMEGPVFNYVPLLRRSVILRNANFRLGYTYTWVGEVARASDSILWRGNPAQGIFPGIETSRSTWRANTWDFGVSWSF